MPPRYRGGKAGLLTVRSVFDSDDLIVKRSWQDYIHIERSEIDDGERDLTVICLAAITFQRGAALET